MQYLQRMSRIDYLRREYWFELLIALLLLAGIIQLAVLHDSAGAPSASLWFSVPALVVLVLPLFARRRLPFAAPAAYWLLAAAITFVDGVLVAWVDSLEVVGLASALLLGNLRDRRKAVIGLGLVVGCMLVVVWNIPGPQPTNSFIFIPLRFVAAWIAGYALGGAALVVTRSPLLFLVLIVGLFTLAQRWRNPVPGYDAIPRPRRVMIGLGYAALVVTLTATLPLGRELAQRALQ